MTRRTGLALPPDIPLDEWSRIGRQIFVVHESSSWWLGDWLIYGQSQYPDRYKRAIAETSLDYQTLRNYAWVARRFSISRRRESLSFQHHAELASLPESEQDEWLDRAEKFAWSRNGLRNRLKASRNSGQNGDKTTHDRLNIQMNVLPDRKERWQEAAASTEQDLLSWILSILDEAALRVISERQEKVLAQ